MTRCQSRTGQAVQSPGALFVFFLDPLGQAFANFIRGLPRPPLAYVGIPQKGNHRNRHPGGFGIRQEENPLGGLLLDPTIHPSPEILEDRNRGFQLVGRIVISSDYDEFAFSPLPESGNKFKVTVNGGLRGHSTIENVTRHEDCVDFVFADSL